jgi:HK97 family phage major capsid protein
VIICSEEREAVSTPIIDRPRVTVTGEPATYSRAAPRSYFRDLLKVNRGGDPDAAARLERHARETRVNPNTSDGQGGYFDPPAWLVDQYVGLARAGRPFADAVTRFELPRGVDSVNLPKVTGGGVVAVEPVDGSAVSNVDFTDAYLSGPVRTIAGLSDASMQLAEQIGGAAWDQVVFAELAEDHAQKLDTQLFAGTGSGGQVRGLDSVSGINTVTYTDSTPTGAELAPYLAQAAALVGGKRKMPATHYAMHPRRAAWLFAEGIAAGVPILRDGPDGLTLNGLPVIVDANITTAAGTGADQDKIYCVRAADLVLWEGPRRAEVFTEVLSGTLQVRYRLSTYVAFIGDRLPAGIAVVSGTGLALPAATWGP